MRVVYIGLLFAFNLHCVLTQRIPSKSMLDPVTTKPLITQFLVFSPSSETNIGFDLESGWELNEERKLHLYISGNNLQNTSVVFTTSLTDCTADHFISPIYDLSSEPIVKLNVKLKPVSKTHATAYLCLLSSMRMKANRTSSRNATILQGPYFTFTRDRNPLPLPAKICLILMLFTISGFFR